jgi:hypothetical protein
MTKLIVTFRNFAHAPKNVVPDKGNHPRKCTKLGNDKLASDVKWLKMREIGQCSTSGLIMNVNIQVYF